MDTIGYYDSHTEEYVRSTVNVVFGETRNRFLSYLSAGSRILDFGCGSGRDSRAFQEAGYDVTPVDGSARMCEAAAAFLGRPVQKMLFSELDACGEYDGIWACSSILHLRREELRDVMARMHRALRDPGIVYTSFKYGSFEGERNGRTFIDFTEDTFRDFLGPQSGFSIVDMWQSSDVRPERETEKWLNLILKKERAAVS